jgi:hypothetical protein
VLFVGIRCSDLLAALSLLWLYFSGEVRPRLEKTGKQRKEENSRRNPCPRRQVRIC